MPLKPDESVHPEATDLLLEAEHIKHDRTAISPFHVFGLRYGP